MSRQSSRRTPSFAQSKGRRGLEAHSFAGISLSGGKNTKTAVSVLEYYPQNKRLFLRSIYDNFRSTKGKSSDHYLYQFFAKSEENFELLAVDAPLKLPKCMRCRLACPGYETCNEPEIRWMWKAHHRRGQKKKPNKIFTPYTERCSELFLANELEEPFFPPQAMGANGAPRLARAHFLLRRLGLPAIEFYPKLTLWRVGCDLRVQKSYLRFHRHAIDSDESREFVLRQLIERKIAFIYAQDLGVMIEHPQAFDSFMGSLTAYLKFRGRTVKRPKGYPRSEAWIEFPEEQIKWF